MQKQVQRVALGLSLLAAACSPSGSSPPPPPAPPPPASNVAPVITSAAQVNVQENVSGVAFTVTASDANGDTLSFSIVGGADAALLRINAQTGGVSFVTPPDFEAPADDGRDNSYRARVRVEDGRGGVAEQDLVLQVQDRPGVLRTRRVVSGLNQPVFLRGFPDGSGRVLVAQVGGVVVLLDPAAGTLAAQPFLDVSSSISVGGERGLLGLELAPDFMSSGLVYINVTNLAGDTEVRRLQTVAMRDRVDPSSSDVIFTVAQPFANHNGGWLAFGPDGFLYVALGDGGSANDPQGNGQSRNTTLGKILRLDPAGDAFPNDPNRDYRIPAGNPFATGGGAPEIWALGLRNPYRNSFDRLSGDLFIGDVGQGAVEEVDLAPRGIGGLNFGWNILEGTRAGTGAGFTTGLTPPIAEYPHGNGALQGNSITGGYVYRGPIAQLRGQYIFGDFVNSRVWSIPVSGITQGTTIPNTGFTDRTAQWAPNVGAIGNISSFGEDQVGNLYIVDFDGEVFQIVETE